MFEDITDGIITDSVDKEDVKVTGDVNPACPYCGSVEVGIDTSCGKFECFCVKCNQKWPF